MVEQTERDPLETILAQAAPAPQLPSASHHADQPWPRPPGRLLECAPKARPGYHIIRLTPAYKYTAKQGQYLAFIYYYNKIHGIAPAEADIQHYFGVTAPSVHEMLLILEKQGFITRTPGVARSIRLMVPRAEMPELE